MGIPRYNAIHDTILNLVLIMDNIKMIFSKVLNLVWYLNLNPRACHFGQSVAVSCRVLNLDHTAVLSFVY